MENACNIEVFVDSLFIPGDIVVLLKYLFQNGITKVKMVSNRIRNSNQNEKSV
jgi:hypothetical protein